MGVPLVQPALRHPEAGAGIISDLNLESPPLPSLLPMS